MMRFSKKELLKVMIDTFGSLRFHSLDLIAAGGVWPLLDACAESLETL